MRTFHWEVEPLCLPAAVRHCRKCGRESEFQSSGLFRVNAQKRSLDIWLIYKCKHCQSTWNAEVYARISPKRLDPALLERFTRNDARLAQSYALNLQFLRKNGAAVSELEYRVNGESLCVAEGASLHLINPTGYPVRAAAVLRKGLNLSQSGWDELMESGRLQNDQGLDLRRCKLDKELTVVLAPLRQD